MKDFRHSQIDVLGTMTSHVRQVKNWNSFQQSQQTHQVGSFAETTSSTNTLVDQGVGEVPRVYGTDSSRSLNSDNRPAMVENTTTWNKTTSKKKKIMDKKYRRYEKPPYSYVGLIALAIRSSTNQMLKLSEVLTRISSMFPFFKGEYQGWRDSVRHNLSQNKCFKKVLQDPSRPHSKGNYWTVDVSLIPVEKLKRQNTSVSRNVAPGYTYARDLTEIFDLETGKLKVSKSVGSHYGFHEDYIERQNDSVSTTNADKASSCMSNNTALVNHSNVQPHQENASAPIQWKESHSGFTQNISPNECRTTKSHQIDWNTSYTPHTAYTTTDINQNITFNNSVNTKQPYIEPLICSDLVSSSTDPANYSYQPSPNDLDEVISPIAEPHTSVESPVPTDSSDGEDYPTIARTMVSEQPKLSAINMEKIIKRKRYSRKNRTANKKARVSRSRPSLENKSGSESYSQSGSPESTKSQASYNSTSKTTSPTAQCNGTNGQAKGTTDPVNIEQPPPNQKPFDDNRQKQVKSPANTKKPKLWSNIDHTVGPEGPPNVTWTSSNALQAVKPYFEPNIQSVLDIQNSPNQWSNTLDLTDSQLDITGVEPLNNDNQFSYKQGGLVSDQSEFLKEQAGIVTGRTSNSTAMFNPRLLPPYIPPLSNMQSHLPVYSHILAPTTTSNFYPQSNYPVSQSTYSNTIPNQIHSNTFSQSSSTYQPSTSPYLAASLPTEENQLNTYKLGNQYPQISGFYPNQPTWPTHQMPYVDSGYASSFLPPSL